MNQYKHWLPHLAVLLGIIAIWFKIPPLKVPNTLIRYIATRRLPVPRNMSDASEYLSPKTRDQWEKALEALPATPDKIPAFFFGHGSPMLAFPEDLTTSQSRFDKLLDTMGPKSNLAAFLSDFGPALLKKYKPKGIVVFSAHWETEGERLGVSP